MSAREVVQVLVERPARHGQHRPDRGHPDHGPPPAAGQVAVRDEQKRQNPAQPAELPPGGGEQLGRIAATPPPLRRLQRPTLRRVGHDGAGKSKDQEQPADGIPRLPRGDQRPRARKRRGVDGVEDRVVPRFQPPGERDRSELDRQRQREQRGRKRAQPPVPHPAIVSTPPGRSQQR